MPERADVTVVVPAYQAANSLRRAVESAVNQTCPPVEVLVINDGSPDWREAARSLTGMGSCLRIVEKPNGGVASARNLGIEEARGQWIAFLDADDYWETQKLSRQMAASAKHPSVAILSCRWWLEVPGRPKELSGQGPASVERTLTHPADNAFLTASSLWTGGVVVRRSALAGERFERSVEPAEDRDLWCRLAAKYPVFIIDAPLATYVQSPTSLSNSNVDRDCSSMLEVIRRNEALLSPKERRRQRALVYRRWAAGHLWRRRYRDALRPAMKRLMLQPASGEAWRIAAKAAILSRLT